MGSRQRDCFFPGSLLHLFPAHTEKVKAMFLSQPLVIHLLPSHTNCVQKEKQEIKKKKDLVHRTVCECGSGKSVCLEEFTGEN